MNRTAGRAVALCVVALLGVPARADPGAIAILPMTASEPRLALYTRSVAGVVASGLARSTGAHVETAPSATAPSSVSWVVDGRIVARRGGEIVLEARMRDPASGGAMGTVATRARPLRQIDRLAGELTRDLATLYLAAEAARSRRAQVHAPDVVSAPPPAVAPAPPAVHRSIAASAVTAGLRPRLLIGRIGGQAAGGVVDLGGPAARESRRVASRLGYTGVEGGPTGIAPVAEVTAALTRSGAELALLLDAVDVGFRWRGVLSARGTVRVVVVDPLGRIVFDQLAETDTVIGSRGDRPAALIHFVLEQVFDIVWPGLNAAIAARRPGPAGVSPAVRVPAGAAGP